MLYRLLENQRKKNPGKIAVFGERRSLTYDQLFQEARRAALYLRAQGIRPGQYLVAGLTPGPDFYILFYAAAALGCVLLPVPHSGKLSSRVLALDRVGAVGDREFLQSARA